MRGRVAGLGLSDPGVTRRTTERCLMKDSKPTLQEILDKFREASPKLDDAKRRIALSTYRRLTRGIPASPEAIARDAGIPVAQATAVLADWIGVYTDAEKRVIAFRALSIPALTHPFQVAS